MRAKTPGQLAKKLRPRCNAVSEADLPICAIDKEFSGDRRATGINYG